MYTLLPLTIDTSRVLNASFKDGIKPPSRVTVTLSVPSVCIATHHKLPAMEWVCMQAFTCCLAKICNETTTTYYVRLPRDGICLKKSPEKYWPSL